MEWEQAQQEESSRHERQERGKPETLGVNKELLQPSCRAENGGGVVGMHLSPILCWLEEEGQ